MIPDTSLDNLKASIATFDQELRDQPEWDRWERKGNYKYAIAYEGSLYPPKHIIEMATGAPVHTFSGGDEANDFLRKKGLTIVPLDSQTEFETPKSSSLKESFEAILARYKTFQPGAPIGREHELWRLFERLVECLGESGVLQRHASISLNWSAGRGRLATIPWVSFFDRRETKTTQEGVYCVFLFREDMSGVYWTLNQGVTQPKRKYGGDGARQILKSNAVNIRSTIRVLEPLHFNLDSNIDLHTSGGLGSDYELSTVAYKLYETDAIPSDQQLVADIDALLNTYTRYVDSKFTRHEHGSSWIFQANPKLFDLSGALNELTELSWIIQQHKKKVAVGDQVFLWESGKNAGIVAVAEVLTSPEETAEHDDEKRFSKARDKFGGVRPRVRLIIKQILTERVRRDELLSHTTLSKLGVITFPNATNYRLTSEEYGALMDWIKNGKPLQKGGPQLLSQINPKYDLSDLSAELLVDEPTLEHWIRAIERKGQAVFYGPPGTGKTFIAERLAKHLIAEGDGFSEIVQFHPAYAYEDFIEGIRPRSRPDGGLDYPVVPGRFLEFCKEASKRTSECVLIVDEINRANLSRVFGELMYLLEYRDRQIPLASGGMLKVPANVRLLGTMNTADRSIALVDHALRRRFAFIPLYPNYETLRRYHRENTFPVDTLVEILQRLNKEIGDRHYELGISFFLRPDLENHIQDIWRMEIEPYLEEYFFDQPDKVDVFRWETLQRKFLNGINEF
jgi:MrcB-like, N-terminal domain/AAA domain (dynein-related subfamily)/EVE domain